MPAKLEAELFRRGRSKGLKGDRLDAYVYGTLRNTGWKPKQERKHRKQAQLAALRRMG